jgi:hypothetical protein
MNTRDLMDFGPRERRLAAELLLLFRSPRDKTLRLGEFVSPEYNPISKIVFLVDINFNVGMVRDGYLEDWYICPMCKEEGFGDALAKGKVCCRSYLKREIPIAA